MLKGSTERKGTRAEGGRDKGKGCGMRVSWDLARKLEDPEDTIYRDLALTTPAPG